MKIRIVCILVCTLLFTTVLSGVTVNVVADDWPMFRHDPANSGNSSSPGPNTNNILWTYESRDDLFSSPTVVNGKIYFADWRAFGYRPANRHYDGCGFQASRRGRRRRRRSFGALRRLCSVRPQPALPRRAEYRGHCQRYFPAPRR